MDLRINYTHELYTEAAQALRDRDTEKLENLIRIVRSWLQPQEETEAQVDMLQAMLEAAYDLQDFES